MSAALRIRNIVLSTPTIESQVLNESFKSRIFFKCENLQAVGAFKFRGALSAMTDLSAEQRKAGVVTFSSGNHAQAVALAGKLLNIPTTIIMPSDAPKIKIGATKSYGGKIQFYDRIKEDRELICKEIMKKSGMTLVHPFNDSNVIAGQVFHHLIFRIIYKELHYKLSF
jgi:threonine dehydratase